MDGFQPAGIYVLAILLYTLPCGFLWAASRREARTTLAEMQPLWRTFCIKLAFIVAACATTLSLNLRFFLFAQRRRNPRVPHISRIVDNARTRFCWRTRLELAAGSDWAKQRKTVDGGMVVRDLLFRICDFSGRF